MGNCWPARKGSPVGSEASRVPPSAVTAADTASRRRAARSGDAAPHTEVAAAVGGPRISGYRFRNRILSGSEHDPLRRAFAETVRQMMGRGRIAELRPDLLEKLREPANRGDIGAMRTILDRSVDEIEQRGFARGREQGLEQGREQGREQGLEQHRATLSRLTVRRFGDGTAADLTEVLRGVNDPERLTDMSELVLDCATGGELLAGAQRIAGRK